MAAAQLPGTILSDDESDGVAGRRDGSGKPAKRPSGDDGDDTTDDEMDGDFEFGGLLGEDLGGGGGLVDALGVTRTSASWSYKSALALLERNDSGGTGTAPGRAVERTSVASIIAAARSNMRRGKPAGGEGEEESGSGSSSDSSSGESSSGESSDSDDEVDDAERAGEMEKDVLKVREAPPRRGESSRESQAGEGEASSSGEDSDEDGDASESGKLFRPFSQLQYYRILTRSQICRFLSSPFYHHPHQKGTRKRGPSGSRPTPTSPRPASRRRTTALTPSRSSASPALSSGASPPWASSRPRPYRPPSCRSPWRDGTSARRP